MHEFRWLAPAAVRLSTIPGARDRYPERDQAFWRQIAADVTAPGWEFPRAGERTGGLGYQRATGDELPHPLDLARFTMADERRAELGQLHGLTPTELGLTLFDHGIVLIEGRFRTELEPGEDLAAARERLEEGVQLAAAELSRRVLGDDLEPLLEHLMQVPDAAEHVTRHETGEDAPADEDAAGWWQSPMWVARALEVPAKPADGGAFAKAWVARVGHARDAAVDELLAGERANITEWMNYLYAADHPDTEVMWEALRRAQYFYSAMMGVDSQLRSILSWSMADREEVSLTALREELEHSVNEAQELLLVRAEVGKYGSRSGRAEMRRILEGWDFEEILDHPVREKVQICRERLDSLAADRAARSAMFTDVILMTIGVTSVLATAIALVQFGRDASADAGQSAFDLGRGRITYWFSSQSIDTIVLVSALVSLVLVLVFVWKRRQSIS